MRISDWSSDVCSSDLRSLAPHAAGLVLRAGGGGVVAAVLAAAAVAVQAVARSLARARRAGAVAAGDLRAGGAVLHDERRPARHVHPAGAADRSEEHTSELQSLMRISYAVF